MYMFSRDRRRRRHIVKIDDFLQLTAKKGQEDNKNTP